MSPGELCVARVPIFQGLSRQDQLQVAGFIRPLQVRTGQTVVFPGQPVSRVLIIHSGRLKVSRTTAEGQEQVLRTLSEGDVVGERAFLTGELSDNTVVALEDSRMCVLDHGDLSALLREHPDITQRMLRTLSDRLASAERLLTAVTSSDVGARVAAYLLDLPATLHDGVPGVHLPMAKHEVAAHLGTTPETLSRRLSALVASGAITLQGRRDISIVDLPALERAATPLRATSGI